MMAAGRFASVLCLVLAVSSPGAVSAYSPPQPPLGQQSSRLERRSFFAKVAAAASAGLMAAGFPREAVAAAAGGGVISSKYCAFGEGDGCDDLAGGNEYIKQLQARSSVNKESIQREARNAYYMKNYPDFFATVGKTMVKKPDGSFLVVDDAELAELKAQNKIGVEYATTMGGRVTDLTQKPIKVLKE